MGEQAFPRSVVILKLHTVHLKTPVDCFESIICTGQFKDAHKKAHEVVTKLSKAEVSLSFSVSVHND